MPELTRHWIRLSAKTTQESMKDGLFILYSLASAALSKHY